MRLYLLSMGAGLLVGFIYGVIEVRSPAPPVIALIGLLGILIGEQIPPLAKNYFQRTPLAHAWMHQVRPHVFGHLPGLHAASDPQHGSAADRDGASGSRGQKE